MSRPKPTILLQTINARTTKVEQILQSTAIYAVFYDGQPVNLRSFEITMPDDFKYKKVSFSNSAHAFNLRAKLNTLFKTDKFEVVKLLDGPIIEE